MKKYKNKIEMEKQSDFLENKKEPNYKVINTLFNSQEDFIVLGLCGYTGSGSSSSAKILQKNFKKLFLSTPASSTKNLFEGHEYRILYNYAKVNWESFYRIKVSSLITGSLLEYSIVELVNFIKEFANDSKQDSQLNKICRDFFEAEMFFDFKDWFKIKSSNSRNLCYWLNNDYTEKDLKNKISFVKDTENQVRDCPKNAKTENNSNGLFYPHYPQKSFKIKYSNKNSSFWIRNDELYKFFLTYVSVRKNKTNFDNPLYFYILKKYIYEFLPKTAHDFWFKIESLYHNISKLAMQTIGVNLRIYKKPYPKKSRFSKDGFLKIAEDINYSIKILSDYKLKKYNLVKEIQDNHELIKRINKRTLVVIDSIKNPFESLFLKQRYSNYYLLGIYTEETERKKRLANKGYNQFETKEIDTIESLSEFKKYYKKFCVYYKENRNLKETEKNLKEKDNIERMPVANNLILKLISNKEKLYKILPFVLQNVSSCLDTADIFINNTEDNEALLNLKYTLLKYVSLIMHPGLVLPTNVERCMQIAYTAKLNSGCVSRQVGAVITDKDYHLLSIGWNQQPAGQLPCSYRNLKELINHWSSEAYSDFENDDSDFLKGIKNQVAKVYTSNNVLYQKGKLPYYCFKDLYNAMKNESNQVHPRSLHAEETAFLSLGPAGKMLVKQGCLFTTSSPCELCSKKAKFMGISKIYYVEPYSGISFKHVLSAGDNETRPDFILFTGAIGRAYMQLYTPLIPLKDEHELWLGAKTEYLVLVQGDKNVT